MTTMDLFVAQAGRSTLAFAVDQIAGVAPCPPDLAWPPPPGGVLGWVQGAWGKEGLCVVDPVTRWDAARPGALHGVAGSAAGHRPRPPYLLILASGTLALAVDRYVLSTRPVHPASSVLHARGVYALTPTDDGYALVLDLSRLVAAGPPPMSTGIA
jgi:hypothetical protein